MGSISEGSNEETQRKQAGGERHQKELKSLAPIGTALTLNTVQLLAK